MTPSNQLNLRLRHPEYQQYLDINERESARVRAGYNCHLDQAYGEATLQRVDVFPSSKQNSPILIFIHGGYWRALDKNSYSFVAEPFLKENFTVCIVNYRLIPAVNMEAQLKDVADAIHWIKNKALHYNGNPDTLFLSGHSAGGHLALITYLLNESLRPSIRAICSLSGIFDLQTIKDSYLNEDLQLSEKDTTAYSVSNKDISVLKCPTLISVGSNETEFFIKQSENFYTNNRSLASIDYFEYEDLNHYEIVHKLGLEESPLVKFIVDINKVNSQKD